MKHTNAIDLSALTAASEEVSQHFARIAVGRRNLRSILGAFYTPYPLARSLIQQMLDLENISFSSIIQRSFLEPAAGIGVFAIAYIDEVLDRARQEDLLCEDNVRQLIENVHCTEIDSFTFNVMCRTIASHLIDNYSQYLGARPVTVHAICADALVNISEQKPTLRGPVDFCGSCDVSRGFDYVVTNPPYNLLKPNSKRGIVGEEQKSLDAVRQAVDSNRGLIGVLGVKNLYRIFMGRIMQAWMVEGGSMALVVPATLMGDATAADLRRELLDSYKVSEMVVLGENDPHFPLVSQSIVAFAAKQVKCEGQTSAIRVRSGGAVVEHSRTLIESAGGVIPLAQISPFASQLLNRKIPTLGSNPNIVNRRGEIDVTKFSDQIIALASSNSGVPPLVRGAGISRYARPRAREGFVGNAQRIGPKGALVKQRRLICQQVSQQHQARRIQFALLEPGTFVANSCNVLAIAVSDAGYTEEGLIAYMNSRPINDRFNWTSSNNHVSNGEIDSLPLPHGHDKRWKMLEMMGRAQLTEISDSIDVQIDEIVIDMNANPCCEL